MAFVVVFVLALSAVGMWASGLRVPVHQVLPKVGLYALVLLGAAVYKYRKADQLVAALIIIRVGLLSDLHVYPMFLAGRRPVAYSDAVLARADRVLGLEVPQMLAWIGQHPRARGMARTDCSLWCS